MALTTPVSEIVKGSGNPLLSKHESWARVLLGDIAIIQNGFAFKSSLFNKDAGVPLIRIRDVGKDNTDTNYIGEYDPAYIVEPGDLLIGMDGDFNCARWRGPVGLLNQRVCRVILKTDIYHLKLLDYALPGYLKAINEMTSSVTVKHLSSKTVAQIHLPLPPMNQQKRIVSEIEKQFSRLDEAVDNLKCVKANLKRYKAAVLKAAVEGKLTEQWRKKHPDVEPADKLLERILVERRKKWEEAELSRIEAMGRIAKDDRWKKKYREPSKVNYGALQPLPEKWYWCSSDQLFWFVTSGSRGWAKYYSENGAVFLRVGNLNHDSIKLDLLNVQRVRPPKGAEGRRTQVKANDILISITADVGMVAVIPDGFEEAYINQHISLARPVGSVVSSYIGWYLSSRNGQEQLQALQRGATKAGLRLDDIRAVNIPLPPLDEQLEMVSEIDRHIALAEKLEGEVDMFLRYTERLRQAILKEAFSGKLVPQDPGDEPASVLLEKIREQGKRVTPER